MTPSRPAALRLATIDVGTNTAQLLITEVDAAGWLRPCYEERRFIRLGEAMAATGRVGEAAMERLLTALRAYQAVAAAYGATDVVVAATSASRDAANQATLIRRVRRETGLTYEVLTGDEEATWSFIGACAGVPDLKGRCLVVDIGGGSTELVDGEAPQRIRQRCSMDIGSVRLTEQCFSQMPPLPAEVAQAERLVHLALDAAGIVPEAGTPLLGAAETPLALALVQHGVAAWAHVGVPVVSLAAAQVRRWRTRLLAMAPAAIQALNPAVLTGRADVFAAAVLVLDAVMQRFGLDACRVSPYSLRHGLAVRFAQGRAAAS